MKRLEKGLLLREVADKVRISGERYEKVESGKLRPSISVFKRLVSVLDLDDVICYTLIKKEVMEKGENDNPGVV